MFFVLIKKFLKSKNGEFGVEYALGVALIATVLGASQNQANNSVVAYMVNVATKSG